MNGYIITLKEIRDVADGTRLFVFDKPEDYAFQAGQYVAMMLPGLLAEDKRGPARSFSISSAPCEPDLSFTMRGGESGFKQTMWAMQPGATVTITKPVGFFTFDPSDPRPAVFLVGGIGITPVRSILKQAEHDGNDHAFVLFYGNRSLKDAAFHDELGTLSLPGLRVIDVLSQSDEACPAHEHEQGYICREFLEKQLDNPLGCLYYIVGSPQFIEAMDQMLDALGVPQEQRKQDPFTGMISKSMFEK